MKNSRRLLLVVIGLLLLGLGAVLSRRAAVPAASPQTAAPADPASPAASAAPAHIDRSPQVAALAAAIARRPGAPEIAPRPVRFGMQPGGALRFLGIEPGWQLPAGASAVPGNPAETAQRFLRSHREAFGIENPRLDLTLFRVQPGEGRSYVRLQQTYARLPVFAAETVVQVSDANDIESVITDLATNLSSLDGLSLPLVPKLSETDARGRAAQIVRGELRRGPVNATGATLVVYVPEVLGQPGDATLAWEIPVSSPGEPVRTRGRTIIDATSGKLLNYLDEIYTSTDRLMFDDANNINGDPTPLDATTAVRAEGGAPTMIPEVNNLYDFLGHTHTFYFLYHLRDGYDGAGGQLLTTARYMLNQVQGQPAPSIPWENADAVGNRIRAGDGFEVDDIVAHEFTHLVTEQTSRLIYQNASGAINESFSDIWGEMLDLFNTNLTPATDDRAENRWLIGEELPSGTLDSKKAVRSMKDPPTTTVVFASPDRRGSDLYISAEFDGTNDNGGVHFNSGICNKLYYLLNDGDQFQGRTIAGEGVTNALPLFYEVQANLLFPAADWVDLYRALGQAAVNRGWNAARRTNLDNACRAVEIPDAPYDLFIDQSSRTFTDETPQRPIQEVGIPFVVDDLGPIRSLPLGVAAANAKSTLHLRGTKANYRVPVNYTIKVPLTLEAYKAPATIAR